MSNNQQQQQKQISKQKLIQDKALSYNTTGVVLSALECYANRFQTDEKQRTNIFSAYNNFDCGSTKTEEQLKQQIICQITIMNFSHKLFIHEHGQYEFPKKLSQEQMIGYIKTWGSWVKEEDQKYYASAVAVIEGKDPEMYLSELEGDDGKINPNWFISNVKVIYEANQVGIDAVAQYNEKGIEPDMELNSEKVGQEKINMSAGGEYQRRLDQELMDKIFDLVIKRIKEEEKKQTENPNKERKKEGENVTGEETDNQQEETNNQQEEPTPQEETNKQQEEEPKKDDNQKQPTEHHQCHECCPHENPEPHSEDPQKLKQQLEDRNNQKLSELEKNSSLQELIKSFGSELHPFKSKYTFYRYRDSPTSHTEKCTILSNYLQTHQIENFNTLLEELKIDSSSQQ